MDGGRRLPVPYKMRLVSYVTKFTSGLARNRDGTINRRIADLFEPRVRANGTPANGVWTRDVIIEPETEIGVRLFVPVAADNTEQAQGKKFPVVVYYHGGGFCILTPYFIVYDRFCRRIAREYEVIVVSVHYRRAPEFKYPVAYEDSFKALKWLQTQSKNILPASADLGNCFLMGDSAGGNIVHHMGVKASGMAHELLPLFISGLVLLQPFFGGENRSPAEVHLKDAPVISVTATDWYWKAFLPQGADRNHSACNVTGPHEEDISGLNLPPSFVAIAGWDILKDWDNEYAEKLRAAGKDVEVKTYPNVGHCFFLLSDRAPATLELVRDVKGFIEAKTAQTAVKAPHQPTETEPTFQD